MSQNDFLPFAPTDTGSNLLSESAYLAASDRVNGNQPGVASSQLVNKALRQSSFIIAQFAQWISNKLAQDVLDDANNAEFLAQLYSAFAPNDSMAVENLGFTGTVGSNALTIALKTQDGGDPTATDVTYIGFNQSVSVVGNFVRRSVTAPLSITVPSGATLGVTINNQPTYLYLYALDNAGTVELGIINGFLDEGSVITSTALTTASDSAGVLYSASARSQISVRCIGRMLITPGSPGTWSVAPTEISVIPFKKFGSRVLYPNCSGHTIPLGGIGVTTDSGTFVGSNAGVGFDNVTNQSFSINCSGAGAVMLLVQSAGNNGSNTGLVTKSNTVSSWAQWTRNSTHIYNQTIPQPSSGIPVGSFGTFIDLAPPAGVNTYTFAMSATGSGQITILDMQVVAYEIFP